MADATDSFSRGDGGLGANWSTFAGLSQPIINGTHVQSATESADSPSIYIGATFSDNQYSQIKFNSSDANGLDAGPLVRGATNSTDFFSAGLVNAGQIYIYRGNSFANIGSITFSSAFQDTDWIRLEASGVSPNITIRGFLNGVQDGTVLTGKSGPDSGKPGFNVYHTYTIIHEWLGGPIAGAGTVGIIEQEGYRFRSDDNSEATATWLAAQDTTYSVPLDTNFRLRFLLNSSGDAQTKRFGLQFKKTTESTSSWRMVTT